VLERCTTPFDQDEGDGEVPDPVWETRMCAPGVCAAGLSGEHHCALSAELDPACSSDDPDLLRCDGSRRVQCDDGLAVSEEVCGESCVDGTLGPYCTIGELEPACEGVRRPAAECLLPGGCNPSSCLDADTRVECRYGYPTRYV
jgi:hypothetical protein